jgi:putative transposase
MSHTYTNLLTHVIFSTKDRAPFITATLHDVLLAYMGGIAREIGGALRAANARPDHVHLLCSLPPTMATSDALRLVKTNPRAGCIANGSLPVSIGKPAMAHSASAIPWRLP